MGDERDRRQADLAFAGAVIAFLLLWALLYAWMPPLAILVFLGAVLAYAFLPLVDWLGRLHLPRTLGVLLVALVGAGLVVLAVFLLAPLVAAQLAELPETAAKTWQGLQDLAARLRSRLPDSIGNELDRFVASLQRQAREGAPEASTLTDWASGAAAAVGSIASGIVVLPVLVFLMLRGYHPFVRRIGALVPPRWRQRFGERTRQADDVLSGFIRGQLLVALIIAVLYAIAFSIIGIPLALVVGLLAGLGELIPYLGGAVALLLATLLALAGGQPLDVLWVVIAFLAVQGLEGGLISPWIMGKRVQLGPAIVILSILVGGELFGFVGLLAAVPAAALLKVAGRAAVDAYQASPFFLRRRPA